MPSAAPARLGDVVRYDVPADCTVKEMARWQRFFVRLLDVAMWVVTLTAVLTIVLRGRESSSSSKGKRHAGLALDQGIARQANNYR
jgi:hypothetical protein